MKIIRKIGRGLWRVVCALGRLVVNSADDIIEAIIK